MTRSPLLGVSAGRFHRSCLAAATLLVLPVVTGITGLPGISPWTARTAGAAPPTPREQQLITEVVQRNFEACNREDIDALMQTCSSRMPDREKFRRESLACFAAKDIHYSLVECEVLEVQWPWALARIVQDTHVLDRSVDSDDQAAFWNGTGLMPQAGRVEYLTTCHRENGKWKLHLIVSRMRPIEK
jgi:hypothetical protein